MSEDDYNIFSLEDYRLLKAAAERREKARMAVRAEAERPAGKSPRIIRGYIISKECGRGGTSKITSAFYGKQRIALKSPKDGLSLEDLADVNDFLEKEAELLDEIDHPNIISNRIAGKRLGMFEHEGKVYVPMEFLDMKIDALLDNPSAKNKYITRLLKFMLQALDALQYLHEHEIVHCDVKPQQFMIRHNRIKLYDLGSAMKIGAKPEFSSYTRQYFPPRARIKELTPSIDLYCFGKTVATFLLPLAGKSPLELNKIKKERRDKELMELVRGTGVPNYLVDQIIGRCIGSIDDNRLTAGALRHDVELFGKAYGYLPKEKDDAYFDGWCKSIGVERVPPKNQGLFD